MVELLKVINVIDKYRNKRARYFAIVEDDYLDKKSQIESQYSYNVSDNEMETLIVDKNKINEFYNNYIKLLTNIFNNIKHNDEKEYDFLISLMYHDYTMMLEYNSDVFDKEDEAKIEELEFDDDIKNINNLDELKEQLEKNNKFYLVLINYLIQFNNLDYYDVRKLYYKNEKNDKYLNEMFPLHIVDKLYFTKTITSNQLIDEFQNGEDIATNEIILKLRSLQKYDKKNYEMLVSEMLENFYRNTSYKRSMGMCEDVNYNLLTLLENGNITFLKNNVTGELNSLKCLIQELYNDKIIYDEDFKEKANRYYSINGQKVKEKILKKTK